MSTPEVAIAVGPVHMRVTYFAPTDEWKERSLLGVIPNDVSRALRQVELLVKYATGLDRPSQPAISVRDPSLAWTAAISGRDPSLDWTASLFSELIGSLGEPTSGGWAARLRKARLQPSSGDPEFPPRALKALLTAVSDLFNPRADTGSLNEAVARAESALNDLPNNAETTAARYALEQAKPALQNAAELQRGYDETSEIDQNKLASARHRAEAARSDLLATVSTLFPEDTDIYTDMLARLVEASRRNMHWKQERIPHVTTVSVEMRSPLQVVLEIPAVLWSGVGLTLLVVGERLATMPVRIARKRKEELLKLEKLDAEMASVRAGRADVLAALLLDEGPLRHRRPSEIIFFDPEDPDQDLEVA